MVQSSEKNENDLNVNEIRTFPVPFTLEELKENTSITSNTASQASKEQIINQAFKFHQEGNIQGAAKSYQDFINKGFNDHRIFSNYGTILKDIGKLQEAELLLRKAIHLQPDFAEAHSNLGLLLKDIGKLREAELLLRKAIHLQPDFAEAHSNLGLLLKDIGKLHEANFSTQQAIRLNPYFAMAHLNLGIILKDLGNLKEAEVSTRKAIELNEDFAEAHYNLGIILKDLGNLKEAERCQRKVLDMNPDFTDAHLNLGTVLIDLGNLKEAEYFFKRAIEIKPNLAEAYYGLAAIELVNGNYKSGLENYEFRFKTKRPAIIHGETNIKIAKKTQRFQKGDKLLVISEQGLGDTLQYMRYIPYLRSLGIDVSFSAQEKLHTLIQSSGIDQNPIDPDQVANISEGEWIPLLSLPRYLKVSPEYPIITKPYIFSTKELVKKWETILSKEKKPIIGINWQGNPGIEQSIYQERSLPLKIFSILADQNEISLLSLQKGFGSEQIDHCLFKDKFVTCQPQIDSTWDFLENAAIIENCDLVISCDTSIAHLAGGMGKKVWLLLKDAPFWTWGLEKESTFWYPSMRLFRQKEMNNWQEVMERVSNEITKKFEEKV